MELIVHKGSVFVEEIKEVELRSCTRVQWYHLLWKNKGVKIGFTAAWVLEIVSNVS